MTPRRLRIARVRDRWIRRARRLWHPLDRWRSWFYDLHHYYRHLDWPEYWVRYTNLRLAAQTLHVERAHDFWAHTDYYILRQMYRHRDASFHEVSATIPGGGWLLEWGCGVAPVTNWMRRHRPDVHCIIADVPSRTLEFCKWKYTDRFVRVVTIGEDENPIARVDAVVALEVMEHVPCPIDTLQTLLKALLPGGFLHLDYEDGPAGGGNSEGGVRERRQVLNMLAGLECVVPLATGRGVWRV
jgi:SAM-dependent methyltransferase